MSAMQKNPLILDVKGNSLDDGPGIRSVIFFKGCPLRCTWCQNPESWSLKAELIYEREQCIGCGTCMETCPENAISQDHPFFVDRSICSLCFQCVEKCPSEALRQVGKKMTEEKVFQQVIRYKPFFESSGGGVTLSGGEATLYMEFCQALLKQFKKEGIHTLLETCGQFQMANFEKHLLPWLDTVYMDIKIMDSAGHKTHCGLSNERILDNFARLNQLAASGNFSFLPRTPLIPSITDTQTNIQNLIAFYVAHNIKKISLLSNNPTWIDKCDHLGINDTQIGPDSKLRKFYDQEKLATIKTAFNNQGIKVITS